MLGNPRPPDGTDVVLVHGVFGAGKTRTLSRVVELLDAMPDSLAAFDVLVQCTSLGHEASDADPVPHDLLRPPLLCAEVIHTPMDTAFLLKAKMNGCETHRGKFMLDCQISAIAGFLALDEAHWPAEYAYSPTEVSAPFGSAHLRTCK